MLEKFHGKFTIVMKVHCLECISACFCKLPGIGIRYYTPRVESHDSFFHEGTL